MEHISEQIATMRAELFNKRDHEISMAREVLSQYVTDHNDKQAWRDIDRQVNKLARQWDKLIDKLGKWKTEAAAIENDCENFYGN